MTKSQKSINRVGDCDFSDSSVMRIQVLTLTEEGIKPKLQKSKKKDPRRGWECVYIDTPGETWFTKKEYRHHYPDTNDPNEPSFYYKYAIKITNIADCDGREDPEKNPEWYIELYQVVSPKSLCKKEYDSCLSSCGYERWNHKTNSSDGVVIDYQSVLDYGVGSVLMESEIAHGKLELKQKRNLLMKSIPGVDFMRGFKCDEVFNRVGSTGNDIIRVAVGLQEDIFPWCRPKEV